MNLRSGLLIALVLAICGASGYWFYTNFEKVQKEIDVGFHGAARVNDLLAAQRYFESFGVTTRSVEGLTEFPPPSATLIIPSARYEMGADEAQRLRRWVEAGGHLVVVPSSAFDDEYESADPLLDPLGIQVREVEDPQSEGLVDVDWPDSGDFMTVHMDTYVRLDRAQTKNKILLELADEDGVYLLRLALGRGVITVLSDADFFTNYRIAQHDHAAYLWRVAQLDNSRPIWLVYKDSMPPLHRWLMQHAWTALIAGGLDLILWLWAASRGFGPILAAEPLRRRRLMDHVDATGRFLWRAGQGEQLMKGARQALYRALEIRHPAWAGIASQDLYQRLSALSGVPQEQIQIALLYTHLGSEHEFTKVIQTLERIRKSL
jgi:hypothetical protein